MNLISEDDIRGPDLFEIFNETEVGRENLTEYLEEESHPSKPYRDPLYIVLPMTIIYVAIFLTGIVGNISTCVVIARNKHMHTATNYYLFSLAISDLLLLVSGLPPEMFFMWRKHSYVFGETFCVLQSFAAETSANATVLTITAFTIERYVAICHPFQSHTLSKLSRAVKFVIAIWVSALGLAIPQAIQYGVVTVVGPSPSGPPESYCTLKKVLIPNAFLISICVFFVVPMTVITVLYVLIGLKLRKSRLITVKRPSLNRGDVSRHRTATSQSHVIRMLVAVVVGFFICWAPFHAQRLVAMYGHLDEHPSKTVYIVYIFLTYISGVLYYLSTTINPLLYHIMSHKFRDAFKSTLVQLCSEKKRKSGLKRKYVTIPRPSQRFSCHHQNDLNMVSFHNVKSPTNKCPMNGNFQQIALTITNPDEPVTNERKNVDAEAHISESTVLFVRNGKPVHSPTNNEIKIVKMSDLIKDREQPVARSRGSSSSSQVTLTTSYSKMEDEGNNGQFLNRPDPAKPDTNCNGKMSPIFHEETDLKGKTVKRKCTCWNCDIKKKGISSLANRSLFKSKSQSATLETIAKKIRFLPSKLSKDCEIKNGGFDTSVVPSHGSSGSNSNNNKKHKLTKTLSANTISNSSLQDLDESEFTSSELADIMGQMKQGEVQV